MFNASKKFIIENKNKLLGMALVIATSTAALMIRNKIVADNFLKEKNLYDEFYSMSEED